ncbi:E3 ubiquitin-protein ligase rad18 [Dispira parvispora]|uniref:Postreplication repair E3 ubiquitin-protein ligase RAD18 n=1 Tax=Dispira parvispora TaxID=1520584 RepID=A0A9W8E6P8_9FUNG|nr:E3 ubiquitin-protein ligase rad18 [Dispira parvispora]
MICSDLEDPNDWPLNELRKLDTHLRCGICKEYFTTPVMILNCRHRFCSLCVRRAISAAKQGPADTKVVCPACREPIDSACIQPDTLLGDIVGCFRNCRSQLLELVKRGFKAPQEDLHDSRSDIDDGDISSQYNTTTAVRSTRRRNTKDVPPSSANPTHRYPTRRQVKQSRSPAIEVDNCQSKSRSDLSDDDFIASPRTGEHSTVKRRRTAQTTNATPSPSASVNMVECPICQCFVAENTINKHLDQCLGTGSPLSPSTSRSSGTASSHVHVANLLNGKRGSQSHASNAKYGRPTKLVYSIMSDKQLRKVLRDLGIPAHGDRAMLQHRHTEYLNLYLANEDSSQPKPLAQIVRDLLKWEKTQQNNTTSVTTANVNPSMPMSVAKPSSTPHSTCTSSDSCIATGTNRDIDDQSMVTSSGENERIHQMIQFLKEQRAQLRQSSQTASSDPPSHSTILDSSNADSSKASSEPPDDTIPDEHCNPDDITMDIPPASISMENENAP